MQKYVIFALGLIVIFGAAANAQIPILPAVIGNGASNYIAKWVDTNTLGISSIFDNGNVGIGTTTPSEKLEVDGSIKSSGSIIGSHLNVRTVSAGNIVVDDGNLRLLPVGTVHISQIQQALGSCNLSTYGIMKLLTIVDNSNVWSSQAYMCHIQGNNTDGTLMFKWRSIAP